MNLLDIYNALMSKQITTEQAASTLGLVERDLKFRMTKAGHKLPLTLSVLDKIKADAITREEASRVLGVSVRQINKLQESWSVARPLKAYLVNKAATQIKWEIRKKYAIDFIASGSDFEAAAEAAGCSSRQMRRWVTDLLEKHFDMPYKDLAHVSMSRRKRLADEIETAENLELAKQNVLKSIADGKVSIQEEALNRVLSKRSVSTRRRTHNAGTR